MTLVICKSAVIGKASDTSAKNGSALFQTTRQRSELVNAFSRDGPELVKVVCNQWISMEQAGFYYRFFVTGGPLDNAQMAPPKLELQWMDEPRTIPYAWPDFLEIQQSIRGKAGHIRYEIHGDLAVTADYQPKTLLNGPRHGIKGLADFFEYLSTQDLMLHENIGQIKSSDKPSSRRRAQLEKTGLPVGQPVPIEVWLAGLLEGVIGARDAMQDLLPVQA